MTTLFRIQIGLLRFGGNVDSMPDEILNLILEHPEGSA